MCKRFKLEGRIQNAVRIRYFFAQSQDKRIQKLTVVDSVLLQITGEKIFRTTTKKDNMNLLTATDGITGSLLVRLEEEGKKEEEKEEDMN